MPYRRLGRSGLRLSALSFGSWVTFGNQMAEENARACMTLAYDHGVNFFDNAEVYAEGASEQIMGNVLKKVGWARDTFCVSSRLFGVERNPLNWDYIENTWLRRATQHSKDSKWSTSIFTSVTAPTFILRLRKSFGLCTTSCSKAKFSIGGPPNGPRSRSRKPMRLQHNIT